MTSTQSKALWMWIAPLAGLAALVSFFLLREPIRRWISEEDEPARVDGSAETLPASPEALPELQSTLDGALVARLREVLDQVDELGQELVRDALEPARQLAADLEPLFAGAKDAGAHPDVARVLDLARGAARSIAEADNLDQARVRLGKLNRVLFHLAANAEALRADYHVFRCPMAPDFPYWFQRRESIANPYMGTSMPTCGVRTDWPAEVAGSAPDGGAGGQPSGEVAYWTCSMHPSVRAGEHDTCPICAMNLTPVTVRERDEGLLLVDEHRRQLINLKTTLVARAPLVVPVRGYAEVTLAEPQRHAVNLRVEGWIQDLQVDEPGQVVIAGEPLFSLYSPELYSAQAEFLIAQSGRSEELLRRSRERLRLFSLTEEQIEALSKRGTAEPTVQILAPRSGFLVHKTVIEGSRVPAGETVMEIAGLDPVWIDLEVFEGDLPLLREGLRVSLQLSNVPGGSFVADVDYVYPTLDPARRTARARLVVGNSDRTLRPGMHARARIAIELGERLLVPREAVVYTGPRRIVFLDIGEGRLLPREIETGHGTRSQLEVLSGLEEGDRVVSSGTFLIASESRIRSAETVWGVDDAGE
jgi:membrane fusion protein, copper/silver efflux system